MHPFPTGHQNAHKPSHAAFDPSLQTIITRSSAAGASPSSGSDDGRPIPPSAPAVSPFEQGIINFCSLFTKLFPLWCVLAAVTGFYHPPLFTWFDTTMTSNGLMFIMVRGG